MFKLGTLALALGLISVPLPALAACGDGVLDAGEGCDDDNVTAGDGCSATCTVESGFSCHEQPHVTIVNGSFETSPLLPGGGWTLGTTVPPATIDWVDSTYIDVAHGDTTSCWPAGDGRYSIDMNGSSKGQIYQDLATAVGTTYVLTFLGDANCVESAGFSCNMHCTKRLTVGVADPASASAPYDVQVYDLNGQGAGVPWQPASFTFVARSATTRLIFTGSDPSFAGPMLDRVAIPASVCGPDTCGNGVVSAGETCDDGNHVGGDGCSASCQTEPGYTCATAGAACTTVCGDGIVAGTEQCDDHGTTGGDGCSATCTIEMGFTCVVDPFTNLSVCTMTCGNGTIDPGEQCDDHNTVDHDACSNTCRLGPGEPCTFDAACALGMCSSAGFHCLGCYDTAGPGMTDYNCTSGGPICDTSAFPLCVGCVVDADCPAADVCDDVAHACNVGTRPDAGTDGGPFDAGHDGGSDGGVDAGSDGGIDASLASDAGHDAASTPDAPAAIDAAGIDAGHTGGASGGACFCSMHARTPGTAWRGMLALALVAVAARRRVRR